tara:strand:+ start:94 stop:474 length:381 start_codon:yes stop_codon:yes gene_type:complete
MKHLLCTLLLVFSFSIYSDFEDWESEDKLLWKSYITLNVIDTFQTFNLIDNQKDPNYKNIEANPILGDRPSKAELVILKLGINYMAYKVLDNNPTFRTATLGIMNGIYIKTIQNNHEIGLRINFKI